MADPRIKYDIEANVTGSGDVAALAAQIDKLAGSLDGELKASAQQAAASLRDLTARQNAVDQFVALKTSTAAAADRLRELQQQAQAAARALAETERPTRAQQGALEKMRDAVRAAKSELTAQTAELDRSRSALRAAGIDTGNLAAEQRALNAQMQAARASAQGVAQQYREQAQALEQAKDKTTGAATAMDGLRNAAAAYIGLGAAGKFVEIAAAQEANRKALDQLTGSTQAGGEAMDYLRATANRLGVNLEDATRGYVSLSAATKGTALEGRNTQAIFEAVVGAMSKLGKSSAETQNALLAVSQMASKGTVSMEELRGQLGEALPGAMQSAARAMGVTVAELDKLVSSGQVTAQELLPKLAAELNKTFGTNPPDTINAAMAQLSNKVTAAVGAMTEAGTTTTVLKSAFSALSGTVAALADIFNSAAEAVGVLGKGIAATFFSISQALQGDFKGALTSWKANMAEAMDTAAANIDKVRKSVGLLPADVKAAADNTKPDLDATATAADKLAAAFTGAGAAAGGMASASGAAAQSVAEQYKLGTLQGVLDLADAFTLAGDKAALMSANVQAALAKMGSAELASFSEHLKTAFDTGQIDAQRFAELNNTVLAQSFRSLGLDVNQAFGGISAKTADAINSVDALTTSLRAAGQTGPQAASAIGRALAEATNRADTLAGLDAVKARIESLRGTLGESVTNGLLEQATDQAKKLRAETDAATPGINSLAEAYKTLGITSDAALRDTAAKSREAAQAISQQGGSVREVGAAWQKALQDAIAANNGIATEEMQAQAAAHGLEIAVDNTGKAFVRAAGSAQSMGGAAAQAGSSGASAMYTAVDATEAYIAAMERAQQQAERLDAIERKRKGVDKDGFVTNSKGERAVGGSQVNSELGIVNYLKSAGMDEKTAVETAKRLLDAGGQPVWNNFGFDSTKLAAQNGIYKNFGPYGPTPEMLLNEFVLRDMAQKSGATPTTNPGALQGGATKTVNVNLTLPGGQTKTVPVQGDAAAQALVDALRQAGLTGALS